MAGAAVLSRPFSCKDKPLVVTIRTRAEGGELADDILVAALDEVRVFNEGRAFGAHGGDDHGRARAQVTGPDLAAVQALHAVDDGGLALDLDVRAHAAELRGVAEAVVVHALGHEAGADRR